MKPREIFDEASRAKITAAVAAIERGSSAEVVVAARRESGHYRSADYLGGVIVTFVALAVFLYHPEPFDFTFLPIELLAAFAFGAVLTASVPPLRRLLVSNKRLLDEVERSARSAFFDLGIGKTRARTGVLVFVSAFEKTAVIVADVGVPKSEALEVARQELAHITRSGDLRAFLEALAKVGRELGQLVPRTDDDVNELPDAMAELK